MTPEEVVDVLRRIHAVVDLLYSIPTIEEVESDEVELARLAEMLPYTIQKVIRILLGRQ
jgi:hypothetical protein